MGCCAAYVLWQPMIVDLFEGHEVQKLFTMMMALGGLSPALAPLIGGYVTAAFGWKMVFWLLFALTLVLIAWTLFIYRESLAPANRSRFSASRVLKSYGSFLSSRFFMGTPARLPAALPSIWCFYRSCRLFCRISVIPPAR
nr:MFS transporter [Serratia marcescens]